jgi:hypothetical protein
MLNLETLEERTVFWYSFKADTVLDLEELFVRQSQAMKAFVLTELASTFTQADASTRMRDIVKCTQDRVVEERLTDEQLRQELYQAQLEHPDWFKLDDLDSEED